MTGAGEERIASLMLRHLNSDYNIQLVLFNGPIEYQIPENIKVTYLRKYSNYFLFRALSLPFVFFRYLRFCKNNNIDISISFDNVPNYVNCLLKIIGWKGKVFVREVNYPSLRYNSGLKSFVHRFFIKWCYPKADSLFVNASRIGNDLVESFNVPKELISLFNNPVDFDKINIQSESAIPKPSVFTFIHVGAFRPQKNHYLLIEAFAKLKQLNIQLWLVGKGPLESQILEQIKSNNLQERVKMFGFQANPYQYMSKADCMVLTSDFEGLPNVLIEGMACGLPIVSTDCMSGPREMIAPNSNIENQVKDQIEVGTYGLLSPVGDSQLFAIALEKMYSEEVMYNQMKKGLHIGIQEFELNKVIHSISDIHFA